MVPATDSTKTTEPAQAVAATPADSVAPVAAADSAQTAPATDSAKVAEAAPADSAKEVLEPTATAQADSAQAVPAADTAKVAEATPAEETPAKEETAPREISVTAGKTIMENPWEFLVVSVLFVAATIAIIFTGKD